MENAKQCFSKKHGDINAIYFCQECQIYMCKKCSNLHSELFENHLNYEIGKDKKEINTGLCKEEKHKIELQYFCKTHNQLCCAACISKIKGKGNGQHTDCSVCYIEEVEEEKKNKLKENIQYLEEFSNKIENSINDLKKILEGINENKKELKKQIINVFTKIRNIINEREDELLLNVDNEFNKMFFKEEFVMESEKLQSDIKICLEEGKIINNKNKIEKLNIFIQDCINIEKNIKTIQIIEEKINKFNSFDIKMKFIPNLEEFENNQIIKGIKNFGEIINDYICNLDKSLIIKNNKEYNKALKEWINPSKNIEAQLLYRFSRDGENISKFHELCDNKGATLTLFKVEKDSIAGIFTPLSWDINTFKKYDIETFMFNLNKKEKYNKTGLK